MAKRVPIETARREARKRVLAENPELIEAYTEEWLGERGWVLQTETVSRWAHPEVVEDKG